MKAFLILLGFLFVWIVGHFVINGWHYQTGNGTHVGFVTAVEKNGVIFKTGTAYVKTDLSSSQEDQYCVVDASVYDKLVSFSQSRSHVVLKYVSWLSAGVKYCGNEEAVIIDVQPQ